MKTNMLCFISGLNFGGATKLTLDAIQLLDRKKFNIRIVFHKYDHNALHISKNLRKEKIPYIILKKTFPLWLSKYKVFRYFETKILKYFDNLIYRVKLNSFLLNFRPHEILSNSVLAIDYLSNLYKKQLRSVVYLHLQEKRIGSIPEKYKKFLKTADIVLMCSGVAQKEGLLKLGVKERRLLEFPASLILFDDKKEVSQKIRKRLGWTNDNTIVYSSGVISKRKGFDLFLKMATILKNEGISKVKFMWVGGGTYESYSPIETRHIEERLKLLGTDFYLTGMVKEPYDFFGAGDIFAMCSRDEGLPLVLLESMYMGKSIVGFDNSGIGQAIGNTGTLIEDGNVGKLAQEISRLVQNEHIRKTIGKNAKRRVEEKFDLSKNIVHFEKYLTLSKK